MNASPAYWHAATRPLALVTLLAAFGFGLTVALWLLPLGLIAYGVMIYLGARDPQLMALANQPARPRITSKTFRSYLNAIERTQQELLRSAAQAQGPLARLLAPIGTQARELTQEAYMLCSKGQEIESYLESINLNAVRQQVRDLDTKIAQTTDSYTKQQLSEARQALVDKQENARDLTTFVDRIIAQLQNITATLDNVLAETVRLRTADAVSASSATNQVGQRLSDLKADMDAFQAVLDTAITRTT